MNHRPQNLAPRACGTGDLPVRRTCERRLTVSQAIATVSEANLASIIEITGNLNQVGA